MYAKWKKASLMSMSLVLVLAGCSSAGAPQAQNKGRSQQERSIPVEVKAAAMQNFSNKLTLSGRLEAVQKWDVSPKISGKIINIGVKVGDMVQAGQIIGRLDDQDLSLQSEKAQTSLAAAQARYQETMEPADEETIRQDKNTIEDARNKYEAAQRNVDYVQAQYDRNQSLYAANALSKKELDDVKKSLEDAKTQMASAMTTLKNAQEKLKMDQKGATPAAIHVAKAQVDQSKVDLKVAQLNIANAAIASPTNGIVASVPVNLGMNVSGGTTIAQIVDISSMKVKTQVSDSQVAFIKQGQPVQVKVTGLNKSLTGTIQSISPVADNTKSFPVEIAIPNPNLESKEGMIATVEIPSQAHQALVVPTGAVVNQENKKYLYVVEQGIAKQVEVQVGDSDGVNMEILSGIQAGAQVVVSGQNTLFPDSPVTIMGQNKPLSVSPKSANDKATK